MADYAETLFAQGDAGISAFRIPTLIVLSSGRMLAFCEARRDSLNDSGSIDIVMRAADNGEFGEMRVVVSGGGNTVGNPCPVQDRTTGRLFLLYNANDSDKPEGMILKGLGPRTVHVIYSDDEGKTWSEPRDITADVKLPDWTWYALGPCHGVCTSSGRLMFGANHAVLNRNEGRSGCYYSHIVYSDDHGETWRLGETMGECTNESSVAAFSDGSVLINMRYIPHGEGAVNPHCRAQAWSEDGDHFSDSVLYPELTDPVCQGSVLTISVNGQEEVLLSNACSQKRENVSVRRSRDQGKTWMMERTVWAGPSAYSDMAQLKDGRIAVLCEEGEVSPYERIALHVFELKKK